MQNTIDYANDTLEELAKAHEKLAKRLNEQDYNFTMHSILGMDELLLDSSLMIKALVCELSANVNSAIDSGYTIFSDICKKFDMLDKRMTALEKKEMPE